MIVHVENFPTDLLYPKCLYFSPSIKGGIGATINRKNQAGSELPDG